MLGDDTLDYAHDPENTLTAVAARRGVTPVEAFIDLSLETNGRVLLNYPFLNQRLDAVAEMLADPNVVMGLADAGAHVGQIMDASQPTFFLTNWVRDRGVFPIEEGVRRLTSDTAKLFGITDRGVLREGSFADVNVIDLDGLGLAAARVRARLPRRRRPLRAAGHGLPGHRRQRPGRPEDGGHTGDLAGAMLRSGSSPVGPAQ